MAFAAHGPAMSSSGSQQLRLARVVDVAPLGWVVSPGSLHATPLPLVALYGEDQSIRGFRGHFSRRNPHVAALSADPQALILFTGPNAYASSSWFSNRRLAPTWLYAAARFDVEVTLRPDPESVSEALGELIEAMEQRNGSDWRIEEMSGRYEGLAAGVIAFDAKVVEAIDHYKLALNEEPQERREMVQGLRATGDHVLADWVIRAAHEADLEA